MYHLTGRVRNQQSASLFMVQNHGRSQEVETPAQWRQELGVDIETERTVFNQFKHLDFFVQYSLIYPTQQHDYPSSGKVGKESLLHGKLKLVISRFENIEPG